MYCLCLNLSLSDVPKKLFHQREVTLVASCFWQWEVRYSQCSVWDDVFEWCLYTLLCLIIGGLCINLAKMLFFEKLIMHPKRYILKIYKTPYISWTWVSNHSTSSQLSKFLIESSKVMSQPAKTSMVLIVDRDKIPGGPSSLQKSILVSHLALAAAYVLEGWNWNWANPQISKWCIYHLMRRDNMQLGF